MATAHATRANPRYGVGRMKIIIPCPAPTIDSWATVLAANTATIIKTIAPTRSDQGARLKNTHHTTIANAPTTPPSIPMGSGIGRDNRAAEHDEQLDDGDDHSGPQPERFPGGRSPGRGGSFFWFLFLPSCSSFRGRKGR